ncbi:thermonuclease family protein [Micrococcaceae bacterium Sec7.4]
MNKPPISARTAKFIGVGILAVSMLTVTTSCAEGGGKDAAPAAAATTASAPAATSSAAAKKPLRAQLVSVIDADTIEVLPVSEKNGQPTGEPSLKVRMLGVTAPDASACGGPEALANFKSLFRPNEPVAVTYEPALTNTTDKDGNTLAYVVTGTGVTSDVGSRMVQDGFATAVYPEGQTVPKDFSQYLSYNKIAVDQKLGIWAKCPAPKA